MQLTVEKCDGSTEVYLHTKVLGTIAAALSDSGHYQEGIAEQLAETVTTFLRRRYGCGPVTSDEIHSMVEVVLADTNYSMAAWALHEHRMIRSIKRSRMEVIRGYSLADQDARSRPGMRKTVQSVQPWNKSVIVRELERNRRLPHDMARAVAAAVEEMVLKLDCRCLTSALVRELVANELIIMKQAEAALAEQVECKEVMEAPVVVGAG